MITDPIANMLTIIRNGLLVKKPSVIIPYSKIKFAIALVLKKEELVSDVMKRGKKAKKYIEIILKYDKNGIPVIHEIKRISKPSRRVYIRHNELHPLKQGQGFSIISTSKGLMTNMEAKKRKMGGEIICEVW